MLNKVVLITGSSSGIGEATAISLARLGCKLTIHGTNQERLEQVALKCQAISPEKLRPVEVLGDFNDTEETARRLIDKTLAAYNRLDILVNNAGLFAPMNFNSPGAYENFEKLMRINLNSTVRLTHLAAPHLCESKGCVVNVSSNLGTKPMGNCFAYSSAKAAINMFTKSIAIDLAPHVRVNSVSPGPVATLMSTRVGMATETFRESVGKACLTNRVGEPEEVARLIVFLVSPESAYITGSDFIIDGGSTIKPEGKIMGQDK